MSTTLEPILEAYGYTSHAQQLAAISLLAASGAFGPLPGVENVLSDAQSEAILKNIKFENPEDAVHWLHGATQEFMLRPHGLERHHCIEPESYHAQRASLISTLGFAGLLSEVAPKEKHYDHVLVLGAMESDANTRIDLLKDTWDRGVRFDAVHLLGSDRPLDPMHEPIANLNMDGKSLKTEMQMMQAHYLEKQSEWPQELRAVPVQSVNAPSHDDGSRANTQDTVRMWLATNPNPGRVLVITNQPHVAYQHAAVKSLLPADFEVETIGARATEGNLAITVAMDAIARQIDVGLPRLMETLKTQAPVNIPADFASRLRKSRAQQPSMILAC